MAMIPRYRQPYLITYTHTPSVCCAFGSKEESPRAWVGPHAQIIRKEHEEIDPKFFNRPAARSDSSFIDFALLILFLKGSDLDQRSKDGAE